MAKGVIAHSQILSCSQGQCIFGVLVNGGYGVKGPPLGRSSYVIDFVEVFERASV